MNGEVDAQVTYRSGTNPDHPDWDVLHVIYQRQKRPINSFLIARRPDGAILQVRDVVLDRWEIITEPDRLDFARRQFAARDRLKAEQDAQNPGGAGEA